jgi:hypothetical protein
MPPITGSEKQSDEKRGTPLFAECIDGLVKRQFPSAS